MITFFNFDGSVVGTLPAGFTNTTTIPGLIGQFVVGTGGSISSPNALHDAGGSSGGTALWTGTLAADSAIQFDQVVNLGGGVVHPLIRMSGDGQTGYGAFIHWNTPKIDFVVLDAGGRITTIASPSIPSYANGAQVTVKLEAQGNQIRFKSWPTGSTEPTSWTASTTDSTVSAAGYAGFSGGGGSVDDVYIGPASTTFTGGFVPPTLTLTMPNATSVACSWTAATQAGGSVGYQLQRSAHGANAFTAVAGATASPYVDTTVVASSSYDYRVVASDGINAPVSSHVVTVTIGATALPYVAGSGQAIGINFLDGLGNPANLVSVHSANEIQTLTLSGSLASPLRLTFNGQTTGSIGLTPGLPSAYGLFVVPVVANVANTLAVNLTAGGGANSAHGRVDIIDGGAIVATAFIDQLSGTPDYTGTDPGGHTIYWKNLPVITPRASTVQVLFTSTQNDGLFVVADVVSSTTDGVHFTYVDDAGSGFSCATMSSITGFGSLYDGTFHYGNLSVGGPTFSLNPANIQAALQALTNVGPGGVTALANSDGSVSLTFGGSLANVAQPLLTTSDPAVTVAQTWLGGQYPSYRLNGGSPVNLLPSEFVWGAGLFQGANGSQSPPYMASGLWVFLRRLPQSPIAPRARGSTDRTATAGLWWGVRLTAGGRSRPPRRATTRSSPSMACPAEPTRSR